MFSAETLPLDQIAHVLTNSPQLRFLELRRVNFHDARNTQAISTGSLQTLRIYHLELDAFCILFGPTSP